jgi:hypothetical protein
VTANLLRNNIMAQEQQLPEIKLDVTQLYREEIFTDRKAGTLRRLVHVLADGNTDAARPCCIPDRRGC